MNHSYRARLSKLILQQLCGLLFAATGHIQAGEPEARWYLLPEPAAASHLVKVAIEGAESTVLVPVIGRGAEIQFPEKNGIDAAFPDASALRKKAEENANAILSSLQPEWVRNKKQVIEYGVLRSDYPLVATGLTAPDLRKRFSGVLGPKILVIVPNRYTIYLFPALASRYEDYIETFNNAYRATPYPVSLELFEISESGIKAVGVFE